jgi:hypothetical protein
LLPPPRRPLTTTTSSSTSNGAHSLIRSVLVHPYVVSTGRHCVFSCVDWNTGKELYCADAIKIAAALRDPDQSSISLTVLDLSDNYIADAGATALAKALGASSLQVLKLGNNRFRSGGFRVQFRQIGYPDAIPAFAEILKVSHWPWCCSISLLVSFRSIQ